jgi:predicted  nucleic acid-binding Zn-ribbon protein
VRHLGTCERHATRDMQSTSELHGRLCDSSVQTQEIRRLRAELEASRFEQRRLASSLAHMEEAVNHSGQELQAFKEAVAAREEQYRLQRTSDQKRFEQAIVEYHQKFAEERNRLAKALEKNLLLGQRLAEDCGVGVANDGAAGSQSTAHLDI